MKFGVVRFPGSCDEVDAVLACERVPGGSAQILWHGDPDLHGIEAVVVPGGFSYGDYLRPGAIARFAKVMVPLEEFAGDGGPVLGVCNGFQVLCEAHLLPGALLQNINMRFACDRVRVRVETTETPWTSGCERGEELTLPIAHNEGNYFADPETLARLEGEDRVVLRYLENPNGSANDIAGVCSEGRNVVGVMPHPERVSDPALGSDEGLRILRSVLAEARV